VRTLAKKRGFKLTQLGIQGTTEIGKGMLAKYKKIQTETDIFDLLGIPYV
jgi:DNA polymerase/3'-5' exonuclease PolX